MKISPYKNRVGFTLIEVLITITLFSFILIMVFSSLHSSSKSWQASNKQSEINDEQRLVLNFIRRQLTQTVPLILIDGKENNVIFQGKPETLYFVSRLPAHRGGGGLHLLSLALTNEDEKSVLVLNHQPVLTEPKLFEHGDLEEASTVALIKDVKSIEFSYFGKKKEDEKEDASWYDEWIEEDRLPTLLSLQITSEAPEKYWPTFFIPVRSQTERGQPQLTLHKAKEFNSS